jgi:hypothetical protein
MVSKSVLELCSAPDRRPWQQIAVSPANCGAAMMSAWLASQRIQGQLWWYKAAFDAAVGEHAPIAGHWDQGGTH